jgi:hypothetical protein
MNDQVTHPCRFCGQQVFTVGKISTGGWVCIVLGLVGSPLLVGIPLFFLGLCLKEKFVSCDTCGRQ